MGVVKKIKTIAFNIINITGTPTVTVLYNTTGRTVNILDIDEEPGFIMLSGSYTDFFSYSANLIGGSLVALVTAKMVFGAIGFNIESPFTSSFVDGAGITVKIEIYD